MPSIIPVGGYLSNEPVTRRFSLSASLYVRSNIDSSNLPASVDIFDGEGTLAMCDVISETVDLAR